MITTTALVVGLTCLVALTTTTQLVAATNTLIMSGLNSPRGLALGPDGGIYVAEAGAGGAGPCQINGQNENRGSLGDINTAHQPLQIRQLSAPDLEALLKSGTAIELVDVRTADERAIAVIEGSRLLDQAYHDALLLRDRDTPIVFQCHHGIRSQHAAEYFRREGFRNLYNLQGGIDAWSLLVDTSVPRY